MFREDAEMEARVTYVVVVRPFRGDDKLLLAGEAEVYTGESGTDIG